MAKNLERQGLLIIASFNDLRLFGRQRGQGYGRHAPNGRFYLFPHHYFFSGRWGWSGRVWHHQEPFCPTHTALCGPNSD